MHLHAAIFAVLASAAVANPVSEQEQAARAEKCNKNVYNCLLSYYNYQPSSIQSYCTSFLSITTSTKTLTSTETSTSYTRTVIKRSAATTIVDASQVTLTATQTDVDEVPVSTTTVSTIYTGSTTTTSTVATLTNVATAVSTLFVCEISSTPPVVTNAPAMQLKRQQTEPAKPFTCADRNGSNGISSGCRCADPAIRTPTVTTATVVTKTVNKVSTVETVTATRTPAITATVVTTLTTAVVRSVTASDILTITSNLTVTESATVTSIVTRTSEAPSVFTLQYSDASSVTQHGYVSTPSDRPGSSGTLIEFRDVQAPGDVFALNPQKQLVITSGSGALTLEKNTRDPFPYLFFDNATSAANTPTFSVCEGSLRGSYPGTQSNDFAVCNGFLSLGADSVYNGPCQRINLRFGAVPSPGP